MQSLAAVVVYFCLVQASTDSEDVEESTGSQDLDESSEHLGPVVTQIYRHPYAASILKHDVYECSAVVLNTNWLLTLTKCFDTKHTTSYLSKHQLNNYTVRVGSSYNMKDGTLHKIKTLVNNFDLKVTAVKLEAPMEFGPQVQAVHIPEPEENVVLGYLASIVAWTPDGHIRVVNTPVIEASICDDDTQLLPGNYICVGGVKDPNRNFCRKDNGGAVIQNNTLIAIATFYQTCALYTRAHAFPKISSFSKWLETVIWDEDNRPTSTTPTTLTTATEETSETTESLTSNPYFVDPSKFLLTLPYDTVNLPLEPAEDNSVLPRISLYESYLQNLAKAKTSTTEDPNAIIDKEKIDWLQKFGKAMLMLPNQMMGKRYDQFEYNK